MSYLSMVEAKLAPGFRFHPRDDELICDYLAPKIISKDRDCGNDNIFPFMIDIDLNKCEPWDLPEMACVGSKEWYFFNLRDRKYSTGQRTNRATLSGYWKATGKDRQVVRKGTLVGMRKTLVFYQGKAPKGKKTDWVMHEFRSEGRSGPPSRLISCKEDWVLCRVFYKSREIRMASKQVTVESYCDDTSSSSLPLLSDACVGMGQCNFQLPPLLPSTSAINIPSNNFNATASTTSLEQVPCFSNYIQIPRQTKDLASSCFKYVYDQLSRWDEKHQQEASSESFLTETAHSSSIWYPFQS